MQPESTRHGKIECGFIAGAMLASLLAGIVFVAGCKVEVLPTREQEKQAEQQKKASEAVSNGVTSLPTPTTDNAAQVIAACGPAASDQVVTLNDKTESGPVRRLVYNSNKREMDLDFLPLQTGSSTSANTQAAVSSSTIWRFNVAHVDNQRLLTAANIRVYLPCAANALAKEF